MEAHLDFETYAEVSLPKVGRAGYVSHPSFRVRLTALCLGSGPVLQWEGYPTFLHLLAQDSRVLFHAFNAPFERAVMARYGGYTPLSRWRCTMAHAYARGFSGGLDAVSAALELPVRKLASGNRLVSKFCAPRKPSQKDASTLWGRWNAPQDWEEFKEYNRVDVDVERRVAQALQQWPMTEDEREAWILDQQINERGVPVDVAMCRAAVNEAQWWEEVYDKAIRTVTGGISGSQVAALLEWAKSQGYTPDDLKAGTIQTFLEENNSDTEGF